MVFNYELFKKTGLSPDSLLILIMIKNKYYKELSDISNASIVPYLCMEELIEFVKGKKDQPTYELARLTKKGKALLRDLQIAGINDEVKQTATKIVELYEGAGYKDKVTNKKQLVERLAWFMSATDFTQEKIIETVDFYVNNIKDPTYLSQAHNLIWKSENIYSKTFNLSQSKLYNLLNA